MSNRLGRLLVVGGLAAVSVTGCSSAEPGSSTGTSAPPVDSDPPSAAELQELIAAADLDPCPTTPAGDAVPASDLPDLTLPCLGGGPDVNLAGLVGKPYVLLVWAGWCAPCAAEAPYLQEVYEQVGDRLGFLGIDVMEPIDYGLDSAARFGITYPSVNDDSEQTRSQLRFRGVPAVFFVDANGSITAPKDVKPFESADAVRAAIRTNLGIVL